MFHLINSKQIDGSEDDIKEVNMLMQKVENQRRSQDFRREWRGFRMSEGDKF